MARLTREQSQALTREKLLSSAREVVAREGYASATVERIADEAGFSKGAFYSNFANKEEIFLELLKRNAGGDVVELTDLLGGYDDPERVIDALCEWANRRARDKRWGSLAVDLLRLARRENTLEERHVSMFTEQWTGLGGLLSQKLFPHGAPEMSPLCVGGIILELIYGGIASFVDDDLPGEMVRVTLTSMHVAHLSKHRQPAGTGRRPAAKARPRAAR